MMVGGADEHVNRIAPILDVLAPPDGWGHMGGPGSGHYVKMVHNGIEYSLMQGYAEGFELLHRSEYGLDVEKIAKLWSHASVVRSWLLDLLALAFEADGNDLSNVEGYVEDSGEGRWTLASGIDHDVPMPALSGALFARFASRDNGDYTARMLAALRNQFGGHAVRSAGGGSAT
jgi:6-phosphogluconate dehydrogenase